MNKRLLGLLFAILCFVSVAQGQTPIPASALKATVIGKRFVNLYWTKSGPEVTSYSVLMDGKVVRSSLKTTESLLIPVQPCNVYSFVVRSFGNRGATSDSPALSISTQTTGGPVNAVLGYSNDEGTELYVTVIDDMSNRICSKVRYAYSINGGAAQESVDTFRVYSGLEKDQTYEVSVVAVDIKTGARSQPVSNRITVVSSTTTTTTTPPPFSTFPKELTISEITETSYKVSWKQIVPAPAKLYIFDGTTQIEIDVASTERVFTDRKKCTKYETKLSAVATDSRKSETAVFPIETAYPPLDPVAEVLTFTTDSDLYTTVCDDSSTRSCYDIEYIYQLNDNKKLNTTSKFMNFANLDKSADYQVKVFARDTRTGKESPVKTSELTRITTTTTPSPFKSADFNIKVDSFVGFTASISWTQTDPPAKSFNIYLDDNKIGSTSDTTFTINKLKPCSKYMVEVEAVAKDGRVVTSQPITMTDLNNETESINDVVLFANPNAKELYVTVIDEDKKRMCNKVEYVYKLNNSNTESSLNKFKVFNSLNTGTEYVVTVMAREMNSGKSKGTFVKKITL